MPKRTRARRDEDKQQRRDDIIDAAERAISRHGLAEVNFGHIAKITRLSRSLIYVYFPTREDLIFAVCERALTSLKQRIETATLKKQSGLDQVIAMSRAYYAFSEEEPLYFNVISDSEAKGIDPNCTSPSHETATARAKDVLGFVAAAVKRGMQDKSISTRIGDPLLSTMAVWAFTHGLIQLSTGKKHLLEEDFGLQTKQLVEQGFRLLRISLAGPKA
jgi:AcrR family transcriptional regulator